MRPRKQSDACGPRRKALGAMQGPWQAPQTRGNSTLRGVRISLDPAKNERNVRKRGLSFESATEFDFESAEGIRVISFRKASKREVKRYAKAKTTQ